MIKHYLSKCCKAPVEVEPKEELKNPEGKTFYHVCTKCNKPTDILDILEEEMKKDLLERYFDDFLHYYYKAPCKGCGHHNSFWATITESEEWKAWTKVGEYDFAECEGLGVISESHFKDFIKFIKK